MELPRAGLVKQLELLLSPEGRGFSYILHDRTTGTVLRLSRAMALSYRRFSQRLLGHGADLPEADLRHGLTALAWVNETRQAAGFALKPFNPMQMQYQLFNAATLQPYLQRLAHLVIGPVGAVILALLAVTVFVLGSRNAWAISSSFENFFSLSAMMTFALIAPFMKIFHETGHMLAATRFGIRLRMAGVNFIGLYPLPFVDCSEADLYATRGQRIAISGAGIVTDLVMAMILFIAWHWTDHAEAKEIFGQLFSYLTVSSLVLNVNPLLRMDGYFIMSDLLGHRNLGTDAAQALKLRRLSLVNWLMGRKSQPLGWPSRYGWGVLIYAMAAFVYRWVIVVTIVWNLLPQYLGLGLLVGGWGAWLTLAQPIQARVNRGPKATGPTGAEPPPSKRRKYTVLGVACVCGVAVLAMPISKTEIIKLSLDTNGLYALTVGHSGFVPGDVTAQGQYFAAEAPILQLNDQNLADMLVVAQMKQAEAQLNLQAQSGLGAAAIQRGQDQQMTADLSRHNLEQEIERLTLHAPSAGWAYFTRVLYPGMHLHAGEMIGYYLPQSEQVALTGALPETLVSEFGRGLRGASLRFAGDYMDIAPQDVLLSEEVTQDSQSLRRSFRLGLTVGVGDDIVQAGHFSLRLDFARKPVLFHITDWLENKISQLRDAEIAEGQRRFTAS